MAFIMDSFHVKDQSLKIVYAASSRAQSKLAVDLRTEVPSVSAPAFMCALLHDGGEAKQMQSNFVKNPVIHLLKWNQPMRCIKWAFPCAAW